MVIISPHPQEKRTQTHVEPALEKAARQFIPQWPLQSFIACNPLLNFESMPFFEALRLARHSLGEGKPLAVEAFSGFLKTGDLSLDWLYERVHHYCDTTERRPWEKWLWHDIRSTLTATKKAPADEAVSQTIAWLKAIPEALLSTEPSPLLVSAWVDHFTHRSIEAAIDAHLIKWLSAYLDNGQALWPLPEKEKGLFHAWRLLAPLDTTLEKPLQDQLKRLLDQCANTRYAVISTVLDQWDVPQHLMVDYFTQHLRRLPGWVGYLRWIEEHQTSQDLVGDYMAIRLCYEWAYCQSIDHHELPVPLTLTALTHHSQSLPTPPAESNPQLVQLAKQLVSLALEQDYSLSALHTILTTNGGSLIKALREFDNTTQRGLLIEAMESGYRDRLFAQLQPAAQANVSPPSSAPKLAQMVFCIDVRSEPMRRYLETPGHIGTVGFAGFFGLPVRLKEFGATYTMDCCPALLSPRYRVEERAQHDASGQATRYRQNKRLLDHTQVTLLQTKKNALSTFGYIETFGLLYAGAMLAKTWAPVVFNRLTHWLGQRYLPSIATRFDLSPNEPPSGVHADQACGITFEEQVYYAEMILTLMGLTDHFSPFVIFCGHGSQTQNNPYASALDCGACGGNHGGPNARLLATILNDTAVREALVLRNIIIPEDTRFIGAEHNTTTDDITLFNLSQLNTAQQTALQPVLDTLKTAARQTSQQRIKALSTHQPHNIAQACVDWSQVRPEWGLARNAAFIAAPRSLTQSIDLEGRAFLHSYEWSQDPEGSVLETIMTAPLIVAEWINTQYLMATLDNHRYGSGTKTLHNVVGQHGVMLGNASDLQVGLPMQSLMRSEHDPYHVPLRLTTVIMAPSEHIQLILDRQAHVKTLCDNEWIFLYSLDPDTHQLRRYIKQNIWQPVD